MQYSLPQLQLLQVSVCQKAHSVLSHALLSEKAVRCSDFHSWGSLFCLILRPFSLEVGSLWYVFHDTFLLRELVGTLIEAGSPHFQCTVWSVKRIESGLLAVGKVEPRNNLPVSHALVLSSMVIRSLRTCESGVTKSL